MKALLLATSLAMMLAACTGTVTQEDPPPPGTPIPSSTGDASPSDGSSSPETEVELAGTSWILTIVDGRDWPIGDARDVTLVFDDDRLGGFSGCNEYGGRWRMAGDRIDVRQITSTLVGCRGAVGTTEERLFHVLTSSPVVGNGGVTELRLTGGGGVLVFHPH